MKTAVAAPVLFRSLVLSGAGLAADTDRLEKTLEEALGDEERICAVVRTLDREISARPDDERLRNLRIAAYGSLSDPYSAGADVDFPAARHPDSPAFQLQECLYAEATGEAQSENRLCRLHVVECCRESGEDNASPTSICLRCCLRMPRKRRRQGSSFLPRWVIPLWSSAKESLSRFARASLVRKLMPRMAVILAHGGSSRMNTRRNSLCRTPRHAVRLSLNTIPKTA